MIIFVIRNKLSNESFVGATRNKLEDQWNKILCATKKNLDYPLYNSIKKYGENAFEIEEWDYADTREELIALEKEAIKLFRAKSLRGYKTSDFNIKKLKSKKKSSIGQESVYNDDIYFNESSQLKTRQIDNAMSDYYYDNNYLAEEPFLEEEDLKNIDKELHKKTLNNKVAINQCSKPAKEKTTTVISVANAQQEYTCKAKPAQPITINSSSVVNLEIEKPNEEQIKFIAMVRQALGRYKKTIATANEQQHVKRISKLKAILHQLN